MNDNTGVRGEFLKSIRNIGNSFDSIKFTHRAISHRPHRLLSAHFEWARWIFRVSAAADFSIFGVVDREMVSGPIDF